MNRNRLLHVLIALLIPAAYSIFVFCDHRFIEYIGSEDAPIETTGAIAFLVASALFLCAYLYSSGQGGTLGKFTTKRNAFYLILAVSFFICLGEEISWGQRLFGWNTPDAWSHANSQQETNLHNLHLFHNPASQKRVGDFLLNHNTLFAACVLTVCVLIPLLNRLWSKAASFFERIGFPIVQLWIGGLVLLNYALFKVTVRLSPTVCYDCAQELKESLYSVLLAVFALCELTRVVARRTRQERGQTQPAPMDPVHRFNGSLPAQHV